MQELKRSKENISKPSKKKMQHLHCSMMIYKTMNLKIWHCKHAEIYMRPSLKTVKIKSMTLLSIVIFLVQVIQIKITLS